MMDDTTADKDIHQLNGQRSMNQFVCSSARAWMTYKPGDQGVTGLTINKILGCSCKAIVYMTTSNNLMWEYVAEDCYEPDISVAQADELISRIDNALKRKRRLTILEAIGAALYASLLCRHLNDSKDYYTGVKDLIATRIEEKLHITYLTSAFLFSISLTILIIIFILFINHPHMNEMLLGAMCGSYGALISVLQRFKEIPIQPYSSSFYISMQGVVRTALGAAFATFFILAHKSGFLFEPLKDNLYALLLFATLSGISERFVPDIIERLHAGASNLGSAEDNEQPANKSLNKDTR